jgi:uroporphyrinogen decarboxylase
MLTSRERVIKTLEFEEPDRIAKQDAYWEDTLARWYNEGLPKNVEPKDYFGLDFDNIYMDASLRLPEKLLEDTDEYTIREDKHGFVGKQWKGKAGALGYLEHTIKTREDWEVYRHRLAVDFGRTSRINQISYFEPFVKYPSWEEMGKIFEDIRKNERYILLHVYGPHEANWRKHGFEETLMDMALDPGFISEMSLAHADLIIEILERAAQYGIKPDGLFFAEDLGINTGPMFSPRAYDKTLFEAHRRIGDYLHENEITYFMHTDGDMRRFIPRLIEAGVQVLEPLEAKAGLDVRKLKKEYGRSLTFMGNIDVQKMSASDEEIEEEVRSKLTVAMEGGGYIYHSDHSVPPTVSFQDYQRLMSLLDKYGAYQ